MINVFYKNRNAIGQLMVALIFLGTFGFLFMFDGFAAKSEAKSCCSGGTPAVTTFAADSSGDFGSDIPMDASSESHIMHKIIPSSSNNNGDGDGDGNCDCTCIEGGCGSCGDNQCNQASSVSCVNGCGGPEGGDGCGPDYTYGCCGDYGKSYCPCELPPTFGMAFTTTYSMTEFSKHFISKSI